MKYLKMLGLTVAAAAVVMAFAGAGTASATVLCKTNTTPCAAGQMYEVGQEFHAVNEGNFLFKAGFAEVVCEGSTAKGSITATGSSTSTVEVGLDETTLVVEGQNQKVGLQFSKCAGTFTVENAGKLVIHYKEKMDGTVTTEGTKLKIVQAGVTCFYGSKEAGAKDIGTLTSSLATGATPTLDVSAELVKEAGSSFLCASPAHWEGSYKVDIPDGAYVAES
jgi:hypothetical protein